MKFFDEKANYPFTYEDKNGAVGGVQAAPPIVVIEGQVPVVPGNAEFVLPAMPIEQQRLLAAQQIGQIYSPTGALH